MVTDPQPSSVSISKYYWDSKRNVWFSVYFLSIYSMSNVDRKVNPIINI